MKAIGLIIVVGCLLASGCGSVRAQTQPSGVQLLLAYNVNRKPNLKPFFEPYVSDDTSWCLVVDGQGRAIAWPDPNRPFDRITHTIGKDRLNALYQQVSEAGMNRAYLPHAGRIESLRQIRPDRVTVLPSATEVAGATDAGGFTIGVGNRLSDQDPARDDPTLAAVRRSLEILQAVYDETLKTGKPERLNYVRYLYWNDFLASSRTEPNQGFVVGDGNFKAWSGGVAWSENRMISADTETRLLAHLTQAGLFGLKPVTRAGFSTIASPSDAKGDSVAIVQARIDGCEITAVVTPAITEILTGFRREMENAPDK